MAWTLAGLALDELATTVADSQDDPTTRSTLAEVVRDLEDAAGASLGATCTDPNVLLVRRFARAHRLLLADERQLDVHRVRKHVLALRALAAPIPLTSTRTRARVGV